MVGNVEKREQEYFFDAVSVVLGWNPKASSPEHAPRLILMKILLSVPASSTNFMALLAPSVNVAALKQQLALMVADAIGIFCSDYETSPTSLRSCQSVILLVALDAAGVLDEASRNDILIPALPQLVTMSKTLCDQGLKTGWKMRKTLVKYSVPNYESDATFRLPYHFKDEEHDVQNLSTDTSSIPLALRPDRDTCTEYIDTLVQNVEEASRPLRLKELLLRDENLSYGELVAIYRLIQLSDGKKDLYFQHA
jgi:hypothetical protein